MAIPQYPPRSTNPGPGGSRPPSTVRPSAPPATIGRGPPGPPPGTVRPLGPPGPPQTVPPRTPIEVPSDRWGAYAGAKTMNWHLNRQIHPHGQRPRPPSVARSPEEELEQQLQMEAELDGVECLGYVSSEVMNEHPSELPDFDRRMWAVDPFYGWRTQERDIHETMSMAKPMDHATVSTLSPRGPPKDPGRDDFRDPSKDLPLQPEQTWMNWFRGSPQQVAEPPRAQKSMLPHAKHLLRKEESDEMPRPSPSAAALRPILEPEMLAAGMAWHDVDQRLWEELHSVGELRRAAAKPQEFPGRLRQFSAHFSGRPPVSMPLEALLPKGSPKSTKPGQKEVDPQAQEVQQGNGQRGLHPPAALVAGIDADGSPEALQKEPAEEQKPKKNKDKNKKEKKDKKDQGEGCQIA